MARLISEGKSFRYFMQTDRSPCGQCLERVGDVIDEDDTFKPQCSDNLKVAVCTCRGLKVVVGPSATCKLQHHDALSGCAANAKS